MTQSIRQDSITIPCLAGLLFLGALASPASATMPPLSGAAPPGLVQAVQDGLFKVDPPAHGLRTQTSNAWRIPVMLVSFADDSIRYSPAQFERLMFDTTHAIPTGSVAEYWRWASGGRIQLSGRVVASVRLPQTHAYYAANNGGFTATGTPRNDFGLMQDALRLGEASVNWLDYDSNFDGFVDMLWIVHAGVGGEGGDPNKLWSVTSHMTRSWSGAGAYPTSTIVPGTLTRQVLVDRFTVLPELSLFHPGQLSEIGVFAHEFGHTLGLPDLYNVVDSHNTGPGNWSLMSSGAYGGDGHSPEYPTHPGAWPMHFFGWDHLTRPQRDTTLVLAPMEVTPDVLDVWYQGVKSPEHFLVENRRRVDYDRNLPGEGLIVYHLDESIIDYWLENNRINANEEPGLQLVEGDGDGDLWLGRNRGDANDPLPGNLNVRRLDDSTIPSLRTFAGLLTNVALGDISPEGLNTRLSVRVRPLGWLPAIDCAAPNFDPVSFRTPARVAARHSSGEESIVMSEYVNGHPQIVLHSSTDWTRTVQLSQSTGAALDPALALLPNGDLGVVWSDTRHGRNEIYFRSRILNHWSDERLLVSLSGSCRTPALAADARGGMYMVFQYQSGDSLQLKFERFHYAWPVGQPVTVIASQLRPENPAILASADGHCYLLWQDRRPAGMVWFATFHPDSGVRSIQPLADDSQGATSYAATLDSSGALYVLWHQSGPQLNELILQTRGGFAGPLVQEESFETLNLPLETMTLEVDAQRALHVAYALVGSTGLQLRYRHKGAGEPWDVASTDLSFPSGDVGGQPILLPRRDGNVDIVYTGGVAQQARFMLRRRVVAPERLTDVSAAPPVATLTALWLAPNPINAGTPFIARIGSLGARTGALGTQTTATLDVFDISGRRMVSVPMLHDRASWTAAVPPGSSRQWPGGVYFARVRDSGQWTRMVIVR